MAGMRIGNVVWVAGWIGVSLLIAVLAVRMGPGPADKVPDPEPMIHVDGGPFMLGAETTRGDEGPVHLVELQPFEIDRVPIVNAQFAAFLNAQGTTSASGSGAYLLDTPWARVRRFGDRFAAEPGYEQHPVIAETWQGARAFCAARGARLPTEAEWERAARGPEGRTYPWGNEPPDASRARFAYRAFDTRPVGSYPAGATPDGLLDMAGNAWQWTSSVYRPYPYRADDGREDPSSDGEHVVRGGGESSSAEMLRSTFRAVGMSKMPPSARPAITFRCARDAA